LPKRLLTRTNKILGEGKLERRVRNILSHNAGGGEVEREKKKKLTDPVEAFIVGAAHELC